MFSRSMQIRSSRPFVHSPSQRQASDPESPSHVPLLLILLSIITPCYKNNQLTACPPSSEVFSLATSRHAFQRLLFNCYRFWSAYITYLRSSLFSSFCKPAKIFSTTILRLWCLSHAKVCSRSPSSYHAKSTIFFQPDLQGAM